MVSESECLITPSPENNNPPEVVRPSISVVEKQTVSTPRKVVFRLFVRLNLSRFCTAQKMSLLRSACRLHPRLSLSLSLSLFSAYRFPRPLVARPPVSQERKSYSSDQNRNWNGLAMGFAAASSAVIFPHEAVASPGDEPAPQRPQDIIRKATKQVGMMGFLKPLTEAEKLAKEQRDLAKFKADCAAKQAADAEAIKKAAATKRPQGRPRKLVPDYIVKLKPTAVQLKKPAKRQHRNWWHPHLMRLILRAVITQDGYLPAVKHLQLHHPVQQVAPVAAIAGTLRRVARHAAFRSRVHHHTVLGCMHACT